MLTHYYTTLQSPLGELALTSDGTALTGVYLPESSRYAGARTGLCRAAPFAQALLQLQEYFAGRRHAFDLKLAAAGTPFQRRVWGALHAIGYGATASYGDIAAALGAAKAARAVGTANGRNPLCIIVPCHRVIAADGGPGGYNSGLEAKAWLLAHEAKALENARKIPGRLRACA